MTTFHELVKELNNSREDQYSTCPCVFESEIQEYYHEVYEFVATFIENVIKETIPYRKDIGFLEIPPPVFKLRKMFREKWKF